MTNLTPEWIEKAKAVKSAEELLEIAKANGVEMRAEDAATYFEQVNANSLDDDLLEGVAGGWLIREEDARDPADQEPGRGGKRKSQCG